TRIIAVDMPNQAEIATDRWQKYLTTVRAIEQKTGYNFFAALTPELQEILENRVDTSTAENRQPR
ncbi:MAG: DNA/RNA non-specific endonuclease, partial [Pyrinomonadaceae bacterium]